MISKLELKPMYTEARMGDITHSYADIRRSKKIWDLLSLKK
jgi:hypothetical protein